MPCGARGESSLRGPRCVSPATAPQTLPSYSLVFLMQSRARLALGTEARPQTPGRNRDPICLTLR